MKSKIFLISLLLFCNVSVFSQDSLTKQSFIQISINIAIPRDYNERYMQSMSPVIDPIDPIGGYSIYNKLGSALTIEYLKQIKSKLFLKTGLDFTMTSSYKTAKGNEILILYKYNLHNLYNQPIKKLYETNHKIISIGPLVGIKYQLNPKSSIFFTTTPNFIDLDIYKNTYWSQQIDKNMELSFFRGFFFMLFKGGYTHLLYKKLSFSLNTIIFSDNMSNPYFGAGLMYKF